jgi:predicted ATP-grasp superfamily ATP-dependent carboligase
MSKGVIVFSGYNQRAVIALLRTLEANKVIYRVIASSPKDTIFQTVYGKNAITRRRPELEITDILDSLSLATKGLAADSFVIAPSTESLNRHLLAHREQYESSGYKVPLVSLALYEKISDKASFTEMCRRAGITVPSDVKDIENALLPFVAKPSSYVASDGSTPSPVIIRTTQDYESFVSSYDKHDFYYQEYIEGESHYLLYYFHSDGRIDKLSQKNLVQQPAGKSVVAAITSDTHSHMISNQYESLLRAEDYRGLIMVEVKKNAEGEFYMIEANPRMWGPSQLFVDAGVNLFLSFLDDYRVVKTTEVVTTHVPRETRYYWGGGPRVAGVNDEGLDYHGYDVVRYRQEKALWESADIYNRKDTSGLYESEIGGV